jgi:hypothetical protein
MVYCEVGVGHDSSVSIVTHNRLYSSGIKFQWGARFSSLIQAGPRATKPPIQWVFPRDTAAGVWHWPPIHLALRLKKEYSYTSTPPLWAFVVCSRVIFTFTFTIKWGGWLDETSTNIFGCYVKVSTVPYKLKKSAYTDLLPEVLFHKIIISADKKERPLPDGNKTHNYRY